MEVGDKIKVVKCRDKRCRCHRNKCFATFLNQKGVVNEIFNFDSRYDCKVKIFGIGKYNNRYPFADKKHLKIIK